MEKPDFLYHITLLENKDSILEKGLLPQTGDRVRKCSYKKERERKDDLISMCEFKDIESWKNCIYKKTEWKDLCVFKVEAKSLKPLYRRKWRNAFEYGFWSPIDPVQLSLEKERI